MSVKHGTNGQPTLAGVWDTFHRLLRREIGTEEAAAQLQVPVERLEVYPRFVAGHVRNAVAKNYAILASLLEGPRWEELFAAYYRAYPARTYEINEAAEGFADFVAARVAAGDPGLTPFHQDLAVLEWQEWLVFSSQVDIPAPETVRQTTLNPTLTILSFRHPVGRYVVAWRRARARGAPPPPVPAAPTEPLATGDSGEVVFVFRHPTTHRVLTRPATPELLFALKVAQEGLSAPQAAQLATTSHGEVESILATAADQGLIVLPPRD